MKDKCKRCGRCCFYFSKKRKWIPCRFLKLIAVEHLNNLPFRFIFSCVCYTKRIGQHIGNQFYCKKRSELHFNIPDCPFNNSKWLLHPMFIKMKQPNDIHGKTT